MARWTDGPWPMAYGAEADMHLCRPASKKQMRALMATQPLGRNNGRVVEKKTRMVWERLSRKKTRAMMTAMPRKHMWREHRGMILLGRHFNGIKSTRRRNILANPFFHWPALVRSRRLGHANGCECSSASARRWVARSNFALCCVGTEQCARRHVCCAGVGVRYSK